MSKWAIVAVEMIALASLFISLVNSPSESGGREMGIIFYVMLTFLLIAGQHGCAQAINRMRQPSIYV